MIALTAFITSGQNLNVFMAHFMAGFFLVFSAFKLLDIQGFAKGYAEYDLLAMRVKAYGFVYPFIELALGIGYLSIPTNFYLNLFTVMIMIFGGIGVSIKVIKP